MEASLYEGEAAIIQRLEERVKAPFSLRKVIDDIDLKTVKMNAITADALVVTSLPMVLGQADRESVIVEPRWQVVVVTENINAKRAQAARDLAGQIALAVIRNLIGWQPASSLGPIKLRQVPQRAYTTNRIFVPLVFGAPTSIDATP